MTLVERKTRKESYGGATTVLKSESGPNAGDNPLIPLSVLGRRVNFRNGYNLNGFRVQFSFKYSYSKNFAF
jgi:hypothetical protein